jgi:hypothetical protein
MPKTGVCPVCNGTLRIPAPFDSTVSWTKSVYSYDAINHTVNCNNCGGQYQHLRPTGVVKLRPDETPCTHKYEGRTIGNCYNEYVCVHCKDKYTIDSGD